MAEDIDDRELQKYLGSLSGKVVQQLSGVVRDEAEKLSQAHRDAIQRMEKPPEETGHLVESCKALPTGDPLAYDVVAGGDLTTRGGYDYALAFEFGTAKQPARSFWRVTNAEKEREITQNIQDAVAEALT